jgi:hypothetical protein
MGHGVGSPEHWWMKTAVAAGGKRDQWPGGYAVTPVISNCASTAALQR